MTGEIVVLGSAVSGLGRLYGEETGSFLILCRNRSPSGPCRSGRSGFHVLDEAGLEPGDVGDAEDAD